MGARTFRELLEDMLTLIGVYAPGTGALSDGNAQIATRVVNRMLDSWRTDGLMVYNTARETFPLSANQQKYTLGGGGDFDTERPTWIEQIKIISLADPAHPYEMPIEILTDQRWAEVGLKSLTSSFPTKVWFNQAYPLAELWFYPIPTLTNLEVALYLPKPLVGFSMTDLGAALALPPAWEECIIHNGAVRCAPMFRTQATADVRRIAAESLQAVRNANSNPVENRADPAWLGHQSGGQFNIFTGQPRR